MTVQPAITGRFWQARNWSADAKGSIHDDSTATRLGFRGGTVAGSIHMDQFVPVLLETFGETWFEKGSLSLYFANATIDGEAVRVLAGQPDALGQSQVWMEKEDGTLVMSGTASLSDHSRSELQRRDQRACAPTELRILAQVPLQEPICDEIARVDGIRQRERLAAGFISDPIPWYLDSSPWGGPVASPSAIVDLLWGVPTARLERHLARAVGLFGAIEVAHIAGPMLLDCEYRVTARAIAVGQSPKTETLWFDSWAQDEGGRQIASHRMLLRFMKASSTLYSDES